MKAFAGKPFAAFLLLASSAFAFASSPAAIDGTWEGSATVRGQQVPIRLQISGPASALKAALINGPEQSAASSATFLDNKLVVAFNYYARTLEATLSGDKQDQLTGTFGLTSTSSAGAGVLAMLQLVTSTLHYGLFDDRGNLPARITFDHRVLDGAFVARGLVELEEVLQTTILEELLKARALNTDSLRGAPGGICA